MSIEQNKKIMTRMIEEVWNQGNLATADELFASRPYQPQRAPTASRVGRGQNPGQDVSRGYA